MVEFFAEHYLFFKAMHIVSVIAWMAGMFYLPRLYVYHTEVSRNSETDQIFQIMERKLLRIIINPAMILSILFAIPLLVITGFAGKWLHVKILLVFIMLVLHMLFSRYRKNFALGVNQHSEKFFRVINELPPLLMIAIVFLVVLKPF
jgi:putative membrane protein